MNRQSDPVSAVRALVESLVDRGLDPTKLVCEGDDAEGLRVVCVPATLRGRLEAMEGSPRDQVVMVRVDADTARKLDAWVETGAVRSRSEAAALFMAEGLSIRDQELAELEGPLAELAAARRRLRERASDVLGSPAQEPNDGDEIDGGPAKRE